MKVFKKVKPSVIVFNVLYLLAAFAGVLLTYLTDNMATFESFLEPEAIAVIVTFQGVVSGALQKYGKPFKRLNQPENES